MHLEGMDTQNKRKAFQFKKLVELKSNIYFWKGLSQVNKLDIQLNSTFTTNKLAKIKLTFKHRLMDLQTLTKFIYQYYSRLD